MTRAERAWQVLDGVPDPEVPALSVRDLGIVRDVVDHGEELEVVLTPTYSGCPATEVIEQSVLSAIEAAELELGASGRVLIRPSGTEPMVRVMVEAAAEEQAHAIAERLADVVRTHL